jgi:hypothetical protein
VQALVWPACAEAEFSPSVIIPAIATMTTQAIIAHLTSLRKRVVCIDPPCNN